MPRAVDVGGAAAARRAALLRHGRSRRRPCRGAEPGRARGDGARCVEEALRAGALGVTTSRTTKHKARDGRFTPSLSAREAELFALAEGMKRARARACCRSIPTSAPASSRRSTPRQSSPAGRCRSCWSRSMRSPKLWRETLDQVHGVRGARPRRQCAGRLAADRRDHGLRDHGASVRRPSGVARAARSLAGRALRRASPAMPSCAAAWSRRRRGDGAARLHGRVVPQDVPDRRPARLRARCRELDRRDRRAHRPHAAGGRARGDDGATTARAC